MNGDVAGTAMAGAVSTPHVGTAPGGGSVEMSVVMPCLNEADTVTDCVLQARRALEGSGASGEVVVADNGSTDESAALAAAAGARVIHVTVQGYGAALMAGIQSSRGRYILMADADGSYDFRELPKFLALLREGYQLVQGCRLPSGGGTIAPGAMPFLHRWVGNPLLSALARSWFGTPIRDIYCGMRAFTCDLYSRLDQRCTGMEFAAEMVVKASFLGARIAEVPITLHPDGRRAHAPHLKTFRDGWRTLRVFLLYSPTRLFVVPGTLLVALGLAASALALPGIPIGGVRFDAHTLLFASLAVVTGYGSILFGVFSRVFAVNEGLLPPDPRLSRFRRLVTLERGLLAGAVLGVAGVSLLGATFVEWARGGFGNLDYSSTMRVVVPGVTVTSLGFQTILGCFLWAVLDLRRR